MDKSVVYKSTKVADGALMKVKRSMQRSYLLLYSAALSGAAAFVYPQNWLPNFLPDWLVKKMRWCPTCPSDLEEAEKRILSYVKSPYYTQYVEIPNNNNSEQDKKYQIWTLAMNTENQKQKLPLVMLHGFASAVGLWVLNLDALSKNRPLYAFDLLGFGRSSRPMFSRDSTEAENRFVESIEEWRKEMGLQKLILLGHSMGGFLATSYAIKHPDRVAHLILADPWGFPERPILPTEQYQPPMRVRIIAAIMKPFNPLAGLRIAGPWGPQLVERFRPDLKNKFVSVVDDPDTISNYIYHCNAQTPSGETAFKAMTAHFGWAKNPMITRITELPNYVPITFIYGGHSWVDWKSGQEVKKLRKNSHVNVHIIEDAGHHVYADQAHLFNKLVQKVCEEVDSLDIMDCNAVSEEKYLNDNETKQQNINVITST